MLKNTSKSSSNHVAYFLGDWVGIKHLLRVSVRKVATTITISTTSVELQIRMRAPKNKRYQDSMGEKKYNVKNKKK